MKQIDIQFYRSKNQARQHCEISGKQESGSSGVHHTVYMPHFPNGQHHVHWSDKVQLIYLKVIMFPIMDVIEQNVMCII